MAALFGSVGFAFAAGGLSILSPCVLPLLPLVLGPALTVHRFGVPALTAGLVLSFVTIGLFVTVVGFAIGLDGDVFRMISAVMLAIMGAVLVSDSLQRHFSVATGGMGDAGNRLIARISPEGLRGQFLLGLLLGAVWSPCVGPTLGAAALLAAQGQDLANAGLVMTAFGLGTALPLLVVGLLSREALLRWRGTMVRAGNGGKRVLGLAALAVAALILSGLDRVLEAALVAASPAWLTALTTRF